MEVRPNNHLSVEASHQRHSTLIGLSTEGDTAGDRVKLGPINRHRASIRLCHPAILLISRNSDHLDPHSLKSEQAAELLPDSRRRRARRSPFHWLLSD